MFFDLLLLKPQHKARLYYAWIAGTRGVQYINKKEVVDLDVTKICLEVQTFVCSESHSPKARFSLRFSTVLVNGILKIYRKQVTYVLDDILKMLIGVSRPLRISPPLGQRVQYSSNGIVLTPPSPIVKKKTKKRVLKDTPESQLAQLVTAITEQTSIEDILSKPEESVQARLDEITLHETQTGRAAQLDVVLEEDEFGPPLQDTDLIRDMLELGISKHVTPLAHVSQPHSLRRTSSFLQKTQEVEMKLPSSLSPEEVEGSTTITVQAMVHAPASMEMQPIEPTERPIEHIDHPSRQEVQIPMEVEEIQVLREIQPDFVEKRGGREVELDVSEKIDKRVKGRKSPQKEKDKNRVTPKRTRVVRIDRSKPDEEQFVQITILPQFKQKITNFSHLLKEYLIFQEPVSRPTTSMTPKIPEIVVTPEAAPAPLRASIEVERPLLMSTPIRRKAPELELQTIEQVVAVAGEERELESPRKRRRLMYMEPELPQFLDFLTLPSDLVTQEQLTEFPTLQPETIESGPLPVLTGQQRQQDIVNKIFTEGQLTLEEVCQKPINKLNIARAFSDVLVLCRHNYVNLISEENSSQLKYIAKGPKMNK